MSEDDLEELKKKKLKQLQEQSQESGNMENQEEEMKKQLKAMASKILTEEARSRLGNVRVAKPDLASQIELQLVQLYRAGQIQDKITDDQLKQMLKALQSNKDYDIKFR